MIGQNPMLVRFFISIVVCLALPAFQERPQFGGAIALRLNDNVSVADPALAQTSAEQQLASLLFPRLLDFDTDGRRKSLLLSRWEVSTDGQTIRLFLKKGDHSGVHQITSGDLAASLQRALLKSPASPSGRILASIAGSQQFLKGEVLWLRGLIVPDDKTLEIHLDYRQPLFLDALADIQLSPVNSVEAPQEILDQLGPFQPEVGRAGILSDNIAFSGGRPFLDYIFTRTEAITPTLVTRGDIIPLDPGKSAEAGSPSVIYPGSRCIFLAFHPDGAVTDPIRRASLLKTLDPESMARIFFGNSGSQLTSLVPPSAVPLELVGEVLPEQEALSNSIHALQIAYPADSAVLKLVAERIKVEMLVAGIEVRLVMYRGENLPACDLFLLDALISDYAPEYSLWRALVRHSTMIENGPNLETPSGDALAWLRSQTRKQSESLEIVPLLQLRHSVAIDNRLKGIRFRFDGSLDLENAWIASLSEQP